MENSVTSLSAKVAASPGSLIPVGEQKVPAPLISAFFYDKEHVDTLKGDYDEDLLNGFRTGRVTWFKIIGVHDPGAVHRVCEVYSVHPLVQEDILNTQQRPKMEEFDEHLFMVLKIPKLAGDGLELEQISLVLGGGFVLAFCEDVSSPIQLVEKRLMLPKSRLRRMGPDYLCYALCDAVVDSFYPVVETLAEQIEAMEKQILENPSNELLATINAQRGLIQELRKAARANREVVEDLQTTEVELVQETTIPYIRDVCDHALQVIESIDSLKESLANLLDVYQNAMSNRLNEVMKVLTIIATLFIPLTFLAGLYGMNFKHMPELDIKWAYPLLLGIMFLLIVVMLSFFRRKKWL